MDWCWSQGAPAGILINTPDFIRWLEGVAVIYLRTLTSVRASLGMAAKGVLLA
jgi:hypothetical protein